MDITPFRIHVDEAELSELTTRLGLTRWSDPSPAAAWEDGTDLEFLQHLVRHWQADYDWRAYEAELNRLPQFTTELQGLRTHFIHQKGTGPRPFPLLLGHGWLGSNFDLRRIIPLLTDPGSQGGDPEDAFDVVAPSLCPATASPSARTARDSALPGLRTSGPSSWPAWGTSSTACSPATGARPWPCGSRPSIPSRWSACT